MIRATLAKRVRTSPLIGEEDLVESLRAGKTWSATRDLTDIAGWADFDFAPEHALPVLRTRLALFPSHSDPRTFPLPKTSGGFRKLLYADPFDEAVYRLAVGEIAPLVDFRLGPEVQSYRLGSIHPTWRLRPYKYGLVTRRQAADERTRSNHFAAVVKLDVKSYYPSVTNKTLHKVLCEHLDCPEEPVERILALIEDLQQHWSVRGIPVGPEASGILGNAVLVPLDNALREEGVAFTRFTDDLTLYLTTGQDWETIESLVVSVLASLGLELNHTKTRHITDPYEARIHAGSDKVLEELGSTLKEAPAKGLEQAKWLFDSEMNRADPDWHRVRYTLKVMANRTDPHAVKLIRDDARLWTGAPAECGHYLGRLHAAGLCDIDWLIELTTTAPTDVTAIGRYNQLLALREGKPRLPQHLADKLENIVMDRSERMPLRVAAADVLPKTKGWKPADSLGLVREVSNAHLRRALTISVRHGATPAKRDLAKLRAVETCLPTLAWLDAQTSKAA